jgi:hypothetical protein
MTGDTTGTESSKNAYKMLTGKLTKKKPIQITIHVWEEKQWYVSEVSEMKFVELSQKKKIAALSFWGPFFLSILFHS